MSDQPPLEPDSSLTPEEVPAVVSEPAAVAAHAEPAEPRPRVDRSTVLLSALVALLAALIGGGFTVWGSAIAASSTYRAALDQQQANTDAARTETARQKRAEVYSAFLDSATAYNLATDSFVATNERLAAQNAGRGEYTLEGPDAAPFLAARRDLLAKLNQVAIYGTDVGFAAAKDLMAIMPLFGTHSRNLFRVNADEFTRTYNTLQLVTCREASARPRPGCS